MNRREPLRFRLSQLAFGDVLHRRKNVLEPPVGGAHAAHVERHEDDRAVLADEALVQRVAFNLAGEKPVEAGDIGRQIVGMRHLGPRPAQEFFARIAKDFTQVIVAAQPFLRRRRTDRDADERQIIELSQHLVRLRLDFQVQGPLALAPEQKDDRTDRGQRNQRDQADPGRQLTQRRHHLAAIEFGDDDPFRPGHRPVGGEHFDAPVINTLPGPRTRCLDRGDHRVVGPLQRPPQGQTTALEAARIVDEQHRVALTPDEQCLAAGAGGRPGIDEGEEELLRPHGEHQPADRFAPTVTGEGDQRHDEVEAQPAVGIGHYFTVPRLVCFQRLRQQRRRARNRAAKLADLEQRHAERVHQQSCFVLHGINRGNQLRADRLAHRAVARLPSQRSHLAHHPGGSHDHGTVILALVQPVLDLAGFEIGDGFQVGEGLALDLRFMNLEHDQAGQGNERAEHYEQHGPLRGTHALQPCTSARDGGSFRDGRPPFPQDDIEQGAGNGNEEQALGDLDPTLQNRVVNAHVQQGAGNGDPQRSEDGIEQAHADRRQSPLVALWINWLRHQVPPPDL